MTEPQLLTNNIQAVIAAALNQPGPPAFDPPETAAEAFAAAQMAAVDGIVRLLATATSPHQRMRLFRKGTVASVAAYCIEPELVRYVDKDLLQGFVKLLAGRMTALCEKLLPLDGGYPDGIPAAVTTSAKPLLEPRTSAETVNMTALIAALQIYRDGLRSLISFHPTSDDLHLILGRRAQLVAFDLLVPYYERNEAIVRAVAIADACWQDCLVFGAAAAADAAND
jgi:hypothetical protein